jgi:putative nucleotidyltransferase with HDIG domain
VAGPLPKIRLLLRDTRALSKKSLTYLSKTFEGLPTHDFLLPPAVRRRKIVSRGIYNVIFAFLTALILIQGSQKNNEIVPLASGEISETEILSPITSEIEPTEVTRSRKEELAKDVAPVFDYDDLALDSWMKKWLGAIRRVRLEFYNSKIPKNMPDAVPARILEVTNQDLSKNDLLFLHQHHFSVNVEHTFEQIVKLLMGRLIAPSSLFPTYYNTGIVVRLINQGLRETTVHDVSRVWSVDQAREWLVQAIGSSHVMRFEAGPRVAELITTIIIPNLKFNQPVTENRIATAIETAKQTPFSVKRGQILVHRGERVSDEMAELLGNLKRMTSTASVVKRFLLTFILLLVFFSVLFRVNVTGHGLWYLSLKDGFFFLCVSILNLALVKLVLPYLQLFFAPLNLGYTAQYLLPISAGGIIVHLMMGKDAAFSYAILISTVIGYLLDQNFYFTVWCFAVTVTAIQTIKSCKQRTDLYKCGAMSGLVGALLVTVFSINQSLGFRTVDWSGIALAVTLSFLSGLLAAVSTSSLIPMLESLFGYTTSLKLLELSNFNHPLLHSLMIKAPGTYHHSVMVGSLAEIAADKIKANSLLARVSAYYHDIGKMNKPLYFIENQQPNHNPHDSLQSSMSAKILFSHVKDGVKLGKEFNLGSKITNIIEQHHGTTLISYFFNKAKKVENPDLDPVDESQFHYPGPRPQTREAAIVMVADACEAATRSINEPTAAKIQAMVHNIINKRFLEEQFNECDLTLSDLRIIEESFTRTLVSLYHHRIEYPGQKNVMEKTATAVSNHRRSNVKV